MAYIDICPVCPARSAWQGCLPCLLPCWRCFATSILLSCSGPCTLSFAFSCNSSTAQVIRIIMGCALLVAVAQHGQARQGSRNQNERCSSGGRQASISPDQVLEQAFGRPRDSNNCIQVKIQDFFAFVHPPEPTKLC